MHTHIAHGFHIHVPHLTRWRFLHTVGWSLLLSALIVGIASTLARATLSLSAALTTADKPDISLYLLLKEEGIGKSILLRESKNQRDYLVETASGPKLVQMKKGGRLWYISTEEPLHGEERN